MARYTGPKERLCRREGTSLGLKGTRCSGEKCGHTRRPGAPGQHGQARKKRLVGYALQLREKQKAKRVYGILEKQFNNYVKKAINKKAVTGEVLMQLLETRLDSVIYRTGFAASRGQARQYIRFGYYAVNDIVVTTTSYQLRPEDVITIVKPERVAVKEEVTYPEWLSVSKEDKKVVINNLPTLTQLEAVSADINPQLIVEFYSR